MTFEEALTKYLQRSGYLTSDQYVVRHRYGTYDSGLCETCSFEMDVLYYETQDGEEGIFDDLPFVALVKELTQQ